jgi:hypothetical protein
MSPGSSTRLSLVWHADEAAEDEETDSLTASQREPLVAGSSVGRRPSISTRRWGAHRGWLAPRRLLLTHASAHECNTSL